MGCCSSTYAEPKEGPQKGLENGNADGRAKGKESNQTSMANGKVHHDKRRDSIDSVYFDAEEDFIAEDDELYVPLNGSTKEIDVEVSQVEATAAAVSKDDVEKTKETLALEETREIFKKYNLRDQTYCRFLRARHWNVPKATLLIQNYLDWREQVDPVHIQWTDIEEEFRTGKVYRLSLSDHKQRHVMILSPGKQNTKNHVQQMKQLVYTMESVIALKPEEKKEKMTVAPVVTPPEEQLIVLLDFTGYTLRNAPPFKTSLETLKILQDYYCERLGEALLLNPPGVFRFLWKLIRPFIDKRTLKKINFLPRNYKECDLLKERFNLEELDTALGGTGNFPYDHEAYGKMMMKEDEERAKNLQ